MIETDRALNVLVGLVGNEDYHVRIAVTESLQIVGSSAIAPLKAALQSPDLEVEAHAAELLGQLSDVDSISFVVAAMMSDEAWARTNVIKALGSSVRESVIPQLLDALTDDDHDVRSAAIGQLARSNHRDAQAAVALALRGDDLRSSATYALDTACATDDIVAALIDIVSGNDPPLVRLNAVKRLREIGDPSARQALEHVWANENESFWVRDEVPAALGAIDGRGVERALLDWFESDDPYRGQALRHLAQAGSEAVLDDLLKLLGSQDPTERCFAIRRLGDTRNTRILRPLIEALQDPHERVRFFAAATFRDWPHEFAVPDLLITLWDPFYQVRATSAEALGAIGSFDATDGLLAIMRQDPMPPDATIEEEPWLVTADAVRGATANALGRIGDPRAIDGLLEALSNEGERLNAYAAKALGELGASRALPALTRQLVNTSNLVKARAAGAIWQISRM
jgi:HEAT repeat protein